MDAVVLALASAALFGAMTVAIRFALARAPDAEAGALLTIVPAFAIALLVAAGGEVDLGGTWPFLLAGVLGPGASQVLFTLAVRDAGPSRTSVTVGTAPLFSVAIALTLLGEPAKAGVIVGALLIVFGGILLVREPGRPEHVRLVGYGFALGATLVFAVRDSLVRHLSLDTEVAPALAAAATLGAGGATVAVWLLATRRTLRLAGWRAYLPAGVLFGLSYLCLFEAYYRGRVSVVSPLVATESLWGVAFSAVFLRRHERVGVRLVGGALLVVAGGALIAIFR